MGLPTLLTIEIQTETAVIEKTILFAKSSVLAHALAELAELDYVRVVREETMAVPVIEHPQDLFTMINHAVAQNEVVADAA